MSNTIRRSHFNKKRRFFTHYWEYFSKSAVTHALQEYEWMKEHQYYGDNYYTKSCKKAKQTLKNGSYRKLRREFRDELSRLRLDLEVSEYMNYSGKPKCIKWDLH